MTEPREPVFTAVDRAKKGLEEFSHPLNPERSKMKGVSLSEAAGLERIGVHLMVLPPGRESFVYHSHLREEEWLFVLSGRGQLEIDGKLRDLGPGDFVGFAAPSLPHQLRNPFGEDLTYLSGGERQPFEVAEFPRLGLVMIRKGMEATLYPLSAGKPLSAYVGEPPRK